jgi:hypothetical protein
VSAQASKTLCSRPGIEDLARNFTSEAK